MQSRAACYTACTSRLSLDAAPAPLTGPPRAEPPRRENVDPAHTGLEPLPCRYTDHSSNDLLILSLRAAHLLLFQLTGTFPVVDLVLIESREFRSDAISDQHQGYIVNLRSYDGLAGIAI